MQARRRGSASSSNESEWTCSCPDFQRRRANCKHILFAMSRILGMSIDGVGDADRRSRALAQRILLIGRRTDGGTDRPSVAASDSKTADPITNNSTATDQPDQPKPRRVIWSVLGTTGCYDVAFQPTGSVASIGSAPPVLTGFRPSSSATDIPAYPKTVDDALAMATRVRIAANFVFAGDESQARQTLADEADETGQSTRYTYQPRSTRRRNGAAAADDDDDDDDDIDIDDDDETDWLPPASTDGPASEGRPPRRASAIRGAAAISAAAARNDDDDDTFEPEPADKPIPEPKKPKKPETAQKPYIGQPCPICLETFDESCEVIYCRKVCGQSCHLVCFARMAEFRRSTACPLCRAPMRIPKAKTTGRRRSGKPSE